MRKICVIGSLNVDLTINLPRFHAPGETITGETFHTYTGGKGGNQAVAAAKLGATVLMVGKLGQDGNGTFYQQTLQNDGINIECVVTVPDISTGVALIEVDRLGENRIAIVPGTNALVDRAQLDRLLPTLMEYDIVMLQLEIPMDTVCYAAKLLHGLGKRVILDPAPAVPLCEALYGNVDYITPNETELALLSGMPTETTQQAEAAARELLRRGTHGVIAKLGGQGCLYVDEAETLYFPGFSVSVVDTTAAGDSFNAGLAVALSQGLGITEALPFANAVGALSTTGAGAQGAMPSMEQVRAFLETKPKKNVRSTGDCSPIDSK